MEPIVWCELMPTVDGRFLLELIERVDTCIPCGWLTADEQRHLDDIRQRINPPEGE